MKRHTMPVLAIPVICSLISLLFCGGPVLGQETLESKPEERQEPVSPVDKPLPRTQQEEPRVAPEGRRAPAASGEQGQPPLPQKGQSPTVPLHSLTISREGNGQGKVTTNPAGTSFRRGALVTLHASPGANSIFDGWSGACSGSSKTCSVTMNGDKAVTAIFSLRTYTIYVRLPVNGVIHPFGAVKAAHGGKRRFQIIPLPGYRVYDVLVDKVSVGAVNSYTFENVTGDHVLEAVFVAR